MKKEPRVRKDLRCVVCRKPLHTVEKYGEKDAFCTSNCCRVFFEIPIPTASGTEQR